MYPQTLFHVVLVEPEIPQNTGNIGRTCVGMWSHLHLIEPLSFEINDKQLKRAGLDYWPDLQWTVHKTWRDWLAQVTDPRRVFYFSTKAVKSYDEVDYQLGDWFVFGKETRGLPEDVIRKNPQQALKIPFPGKIRSFNVANAAAIVLSQGYSCLRRQDVNIGLS